MKKLSIDEISLQRLSGDEVKTARRFPITVILDDIRSLHNVGSIFRTADAIRAKELILCGITGTPPRREIEKTALGSVDSVPWRYEKNALDAVLKVKDAGLPVYALEQTEPSQTLWEAKYTFPCCLIVGNEVFGVQDSLLPHVDSALDIPMFGSKHSLNVSVAFGIAAYDMAAAYLKRQSARPDTI
ncbi:MAG: RNA methyltransferase [Calditrichia bacterium]